MKLIIADKRLKPEIGSTLEKYGEVFWLSSTDVVYDAISGHPDIFISHYKDQVVIAPNAPQELFAFLDLHKVQYKTGSSNLGKKYPQTAAYNVLVTDSQLIHHKNHTDSVVREVFNEKQYVHISQGYTRCSLVQLLDSSFITSDKGIYDSLLSLGFEVQYFSPEGIVLSDFPHGFIGGCIGIDNNDIYFTGSLEFYQEGEKLRSLLTQKNLNIIELYSGPLLDGGSLIFLDSNL